MPVVKEIIEAIEQYAPPCYQEGYDNSRLIVGNTKQVVRGILISLDCTEEVIEEAIKLGYNMIVSHHPILFSGIKSLNGKNYVERVLIKAIKYDIAIYAAHTNLDNVYRGVNQRIAHKLGLQNIRILMPKSTTLKQLYVYVPASHAESLREALWQAGAGQLGDYDQCSFSLSGQGTYRPNTGANPYSGQVGVRESAQEEKIEVVVPAHTEKAVIKAMHQAHPYEEIAYGIVSLQNTNPYIGSGIIGDLSDSVDEHHFLDHVKKHMNTKVIRHTALKNKLIQKIVLCGGSGSFLLPNAIAAQADAFITADMKYHEFFDAEGQILIADIGHYESEQFTGEIFYDIVSKKFPNFAVRLTSVNTNPINYY